MATVIKTEDLVKVDLGQEVDYVHVRIFADWHIGDRHCNFAKIKENVDILKRDPHQYAIVAGDLMNNATKASVSDIYAEKLSPHEQADRIIEILEPVKDKILYMTSGNHENRTFREAGMDPTAIVAAKLDLTDRYSKTGGLLRVALGRDRTCTSKTCPRRIKYYFYILHGSGGGAKPGAKINRLVDLASIVDADVYIHAHTHLPMTTMIPFCRINRTHDLVTMEDRLFVNASAKLNYGGYGKEKGMAPASMADPVIFLNGRRRAIGCSLCNFVEDVK